MSNEEQILQLLLKMQSDMAEVKNDLAGVKDDLAGVKGTLAEHTIALNTLIEWADDAQVVVKVPFAKAK